MFESFTPSAQRAMKRAERLARLRGADLIEPIDLLAALTGEEESRAAELLVEFGVDVARLWTELGPQSSAVPNGPVAAELEIDSSSGESLEDSLPASGALRLVLSDAAMQARGFDRKREVGTEHLLVGLLTSSVAAAELLRGAGLELETFRERWTQQANLDSAPLPRVEGIAPLDLAEPGGGVELGRILDASANRAREGLRVVEDYVRFVLDDPGLTRRLKDVRHRLTQAERGLGSHLLVDSRDTREDVGTHIMTPSEQIRENPRAVLAANFKRIAEAMRSLEEYSKLVDIWLAGRFEVLRYDIYTLEKLTMTAVAARRGLGSAKLMVLVGGLPTLGDLTWLVGEALAGGVDVIQYREKRVADRELLRRAREIRLLTSQARVPLIMNDRVDLSRLAGCDGVHLGQEDLSIRDARRILGPTSHIGISTHERSELDAAILAGAGYLGVGPVFPSPTKEFSDSELAGLAYVRHVARSTTLPWFAIGGINEQNLDQVLDAGATRIAVSAAVIHADSPRRAVRQLKSRLTSGDGDSNGDATSRG